MNIFKGGALAAYNGMKFEKKTDLATAVQAMGFRVERQYIRSKCKKYFFDVVYDNQGRVGFFASKWAFYKTFLEPRGVIWKRYISKQFLPDEAFINERDNTVYVIEKKYQSQHGSTDEKLESCAFKLREYNRIVKPAGMDIQYTYLCNDWFKKPKYRDVIEYVRECGCGLFFNMLPLYALGLQAQEKHQRVDIESIAGVCFFAFRINAAI